MPPRTDESVRITATLEVMHEKASIIHDAERFFLPTILKRFKIQTSALFPRWLHVLVPRETLLEGGHVKKKPLNQAKSSHSTMTAEGPVSSDSDVARASGRGGNGAMLRAATNMTKMHGAARSFAFAGALAQVPPELQEELEDVPSQQTVLQEWEEKMQTSSFRYRKTTPIHAKEAPDNGLLETVFNGVVETRQAYEKGDMIMCGIDGERYTTTLRNFALRYDRNAPEPAGNPLLAEEGFQLYQPIGKVWAFELSADDIVTHFPAGEFTASWKEPVTVETGDYLVMPFPAGDEIYRVRGHAFNDKYFPDLIDEGSTSTVPSQREVVAAWSKELMRPQNIHIKTQSVHAKIAHEAGFLETVVKGVLEGRKTYDSGDYIVCGSRGGKYPMSGEQFALRYVHDAPTKPLSSVLEMQGFQLFEPRGKVWARELDADDLETRFPAGRFIGRWGGTQFVKMGDILAMPYPDGDEVYVIQKALFERSYASSSASPGRILPPITMAVPPPRSGLSSPCCERIQR